MFSGPWFLGEIAKGVDYGLAPLPTISENGNKPMRPWITVEGVYVAAPSKNKDAAFAFLKYVTDLPAAFARRLGGQGVLVNSIDGSSPAARELQPNDVIVQIDDAQVTGPEDFDRLILDELQADLVALDVDQHVAHHARRAGRSGQEDVHAEA